MTCRLRRTSPTQPSVCPSTGRRRPTSSLRPAQATISSRSSRWTRIVVASARRARFVSSTISRYSSSRSCDAASRPAMSRTVSRRSASSASAPGPDGTVGASAGESECRVFRSLPMIRRRIDPPTSRPARSVGRAAAGDPVRTGGSQAVTGRARTLRWSHRDRRSGGRHRSGGGADYRPGALTVRARADYTPAASRPVRGPAVRTRDPRSALPVDDGPSPIGGGHAVIIRNPVRPAP